MTLMTTKAYLPDGVWEDELGRAVAPFDLLVPFEENPAIRATSTRTRARRSHRSRTQSTRSVSERPSTSTLRGASSGCRAGIVAGRRRCSSTRSASGPTRLASTRASSSLGTRGPKTSVPSKGSRSPFALRQRTSSSWKPTCGCRNHSASNGRPTACCTSTRARTTARTTSSGMTRRRWPPSWACPSAGSALQHDRGEQGPLRRVPGIRA